MKKRIITTAIVIIAACFAFQGCGQPASAPAEETPSKEPTSSASAEPTQKPQPSVGDTTTNKTLALKFDKYEEPATISYDETGARRYQAKQPEEGMKWVAATMTVTNNGKHSIDLTCSLPVTIKAVDSQSREFDPIQSLYGVQGNPQCDSQTQPGQSKTVTYVFSVAKDSQIRGFGWYDSEDFDGDYTMSIFVTDKAYRVTAA